MRLPMQEQRIFLLVFEENATAIAGAEDFPPWSFLTNFYQILLYCAVSHASSITSAGQKN